METPTDHSGSRTSASDAECVIHAAGVHVAIDDSSILRDVDIDVHSGQLVGLVGPNGSGKTTLLRAISGLQPFRGEIALRGQPIGTWKPKALARELAFVRQSVSLSFDFTVSELVLMGRSPHKGWFEDYDAEDRRRMVEALRHVDLDGFQDRSVLSLSGGELQRVFLAQALVQEADILLLDEPIAHLDVHYQFEFMDLVARLVDVGRTAVVVFHDLEMAARYSNQLIVLSQGRVAAAERPGRVLTEGLIRDVFRMDARVTASSDERLHIEYYTPTRRVRPASE